MLDEEIVVELLEEPEQSFGDKWREIKQKVLTSFQYSAILLSYIPFGLWFLLMGPSRADPVFRAIIDFMPFLGLILLLGSIIVVSSQSLLLNQIKGAGKSVLDAEVIHPNKDYGFTIQNVILYYAKIEDNPELFKTIMDDYNQRKRIVEFGKDFDDELEFDEDGKLIVDGIDDPEKFEAELKKKREEESRGNLKKFVKWLGSPHFRRRKAEEPEEGHSAYVTYTTSGVPLLVTEETNKDLYEKIKAQQSDDYEFPEGEKEVVAHDFRYYFENFPIMAQPLLESGFWNFLLLKFKLGYWIGNSYTKAMFLLSREDSLDKLFPSTKRFIELEGIIGESYVYHTILVLIGFWRNIPICVPMHTNEKIDLMTNHRQRAYELEPHIHQWDENTGLCTELATTKEGGRVPCARSLVSFVREWYYSMEVSPTQEEIIGAHNRAEMAMLKGYFTMSRDYEIKIQEQSVLMNHLLDRGTAMDDEFLEIDLLLAGKEQTFKENSKTTIYIVAAAIIGFLVGHLGLINI